MKRALVSTLISMAVVVAHAQNTPAPSSAPGVATSQDKSTQKTGKKHHHSKKSAQAQTSSSGSAVNQPK